MVDDLDRVVPFSDAALVVAFGQMLHDVFAGEIDEELFLKAISGQAWVGSLEKLGRAWRDSDANGVDAFRSAWGLEPVDTRSDLAPQVIEEPVQPRSEIVRELETVRLPQLIGTEQDSPDAQVAIKPPASTAPRLPWEIQQWIGLTEGRRTRRSP